MRIMGLDYGSKTVGVAISDALRLTAQAVETIEEKKKKINVRRTCARIEELIKKYDVEKIVLGFPKHMNNDIGERAQQSMEFGEMLKRRTGLEVILWDERLTTVEAERTLIESNVRREKQKETYRSDRRSCLFCRVYLDLMHMKKTGRMNEVCHFLIGNEPKFGYAKALALLTSRDVSFGAFGDFVQDIRIEK